MSEEYGKLAKVVATVDDYSFAINRGKTDGLQLGDRFLVFRLGEEITDPDSGENLGTLEIVLGRAKVMHLQPKIATLKSIETTTIQGDKKTIRKRNALYQFTSTYGDEEILEKPNEILNEIDVVTGDLVKPY